jgi:cobalt-zinc-cadmium resistance protein CzcA
MMLYRPVGQSLAASVEDQIRTEDLIRRQFPEVERVFSRIGTSEVATDPMPPNEADFYIDYNPRSQWRPVNGRIPLKQELAESIAAALKQDMTNTDIVIGQPIEMRFNEMLEGVRADLSIKIFGPDFDVLDAAAEKIKGLLEKTPGATAVEFETDGRPPMLNITLKREELLRRGLTSASVNDAISTALAGRNTGHILHDAHSHEVVVRLPDAARNDPGQIRKLPIRVGDHGIISLGEVADIATTEAVEPIRRDDGKRRAALLVNLDTSDIERWVGDARRIILEKVPLPDGYSIEFGGQFEHLREARARLMIVVPAALALIFILIFIAFGSIRQAALVYTGIPLAVMGGVFALWARGMPFSITAAVGFIALSGVAVLNGVVMVSYFNQLRKNGVALAEAVHQGALSRLRPVLMTALVAALGFLPMAISHGAGAEVQRPLATVVIGGIATSTFLTLVLLPMLYSTFERRAAARQSGAASVTNTGCPP